MNLTEITINIYTIILKNVFVINLRKRPGSLELAPNAYREAAFADLPTRYSHNTRY
jgi:hypothetical protein